MFSYEALKVFHVLAAFVFVAVGVASFLSAGKSRFWAMVFYSASMAVVFGGFALIGALRDGLTGWMMAKFAVWIVMMAVHGIFLRRFPYLLTMATGIFFFLTGVAIFLAVYKPSLF